MPQHNEGNEFANAIVVGDHPDTQHLYSSINKIYENLGHPPGSGVVWFNDIGTLNAEQLTEFCKSFPRENDIDSRCYGHAAERFVGLQEEVLYHIIGNGDDQPWFLLHETNLCQGWNTDYLFLTPDFIKRDGEIVTDLTDVQWKDEDPIGQVVERAQLDKDGRIVVNESFQLVEKDGTVLETLYFVGPLIAPQYTGQTFEEQTKIALDHFDRVYPRLTCLEERDIWLNAWRQKQEQQNSFGQHPPAPKWRPGN